MKIISSFLKIAFCLVALALGTMAFYTPDAKKVTLTCEILGAKSTDSLYLYTFTGVGFEPYQAVGSKDQKTFVFKVPSSKPTFYYAGTKDMQVKSVILGEEPEVKMIGNMSRMRQARVKEGVNALYNQSIDESRKLKNQQITLSQQYRKVFQDEAQRAVVAAQMAEVDQKKRDLLESVKEQDAFVGNIIGLYVYYSFQNNNDKNYPNELAYFANEYLANADLTQKGMNRVPMVYDAFNSFTVMLCKTNAFNKEQLTQVLDANLSRLDEKSTAYKYALGGISGALRKQNNPAFLDYGIRLVEKYKDDKSVSMQQFAKQVSLAKAFLPGAVAPDFTQNTPEGQPLSLSDLRGKVVLVDFWASWCGPCRRENPHVVALYNKYKDKGFDVLGVSLDKDMPRWTKAIKDDGLTWNHVSDLKGWKNEVAQMYSVSSVPHTILLDAEGRIIGRKLRAQQLEAKLKEIFGE